MKKNITQEELQRMACRVLLATLSIPLPSAHPEFDRFIETDKSPLEKAQRLAVLLGLFQPPTRASLLKDLVRVNVVALATPQLQELYNWLEVEFHPLLLCSRVQMVIKSIMQEENSPLQQYIKALQDVTLVRLVRQIAQVYQTIEFDRLIELSKFSTPFHMERLLVDCVRYNDMQVRIDHGKKCVHFGMDLSESQREDKPEGPTLQVMPSEQIRNQLVNMSIVLHQAIGVINPQRKKAERDRLRTLMVQNYHDNKLREHQKILQRHKIIEDRKEYIERLNTVREEEEQRRLEEIQRQHQLAEQKRLEHEREERERKRAQNEIQQIKDRHLKEKLLQIKLTGHGQKILKKLDEDDIKKLDADQIAAKEAEELQKERRELLAKLKSQEKKVDYFERAKRLEEIPLLQASIKEKQLQDQNFWELQETERIAIAIEERKLAVATRDRLLRMKPDKDAFLEKLKKERNIVYEDKVKEFEELLAQERKKRLQKRKVERKEDRRINWLKEKEKYEQKKREEQRRKEEEERMRLEEIARKDREERERIQREEKDKRNKENKEMLERVAAKQRAKEEEIDRKLRAQQEQLAEQVKGKDWRNKGSDKRSERDRDSDRPSLRDRDSDRPSLRDRDSDRPSLRDRDSDRPSLRDRDSDRPLLRDKDSDRRPLEKDSERKSQISDRERDAERRTITSDRDRSKPAESESTDGGNSWRRIDSKPSEPSDEGKKTEAYKPKFRMNAEELRSSDSAPSAWRNFKNEEKRDEDKDRRDDRERRDDRDWRPVKDGEDRNISRGGGSFMRRDDNRYSKKDDREDRGPRRDDDQDREDRSFRRDFRGDSRRQDDKDEGRIGGGAWRTGGLDKRRDDREDNRGPRKDDRDRDEAPRDMGSWRSSRKADEDQPSSVYRPPRGGMNRDRDTARDRDGPPREKDSARSRDVPRDKEAPKESSDWRTTRTKGGDDQIKRTGGGDDKPPAPSKEKVREPSEKPQTEDADGWSTVSKRR
ncbi:hypothetical protein HHI36_008646 [Cryptolaemus montrouzieri]|uniref:PCI domain-containing protein n=1 Tax=Cryptolaemus montrouzieri TaxID=559131 RepID=A0ABD2MTD9_9CUCU